MSNRSSRVVLACLFVVLAGCATPPPAGVVFPTLSPRREALSYFPPDAPVVAVVATDPQDPGLRRLAASGALGPLERVAAARGLHYAQLRGLLGEDAVVGQPHVGGPPLAVLATGDARTLQDLARARVRAGLATPAGTYRGGELFAERGWAFAVRGQVLLVSSGSRDLIEALDTRVSDESFDVTRLNAVLPADPPPAAFLRAYVDLRPMVAAAGPVARAVPVLRALSTAGVTVGASATELLAALGADTSDEGLTEADLPAGARAGGERPPLPDRQPAFAVADVARLILAAERAARVALPVGVLRADALRARLAGAGVRLTPRLLQGPAVVVLGRDGPRLRLQPARPGDVAVALDRAARRLRAPGLRVLREGGLYAVRSRGRLVVRAGMVGNALVAGRAAPAALRRLGAAPPTRLRSPALLRFPSLGALYPRPLVVTFEGTPNALRLEGFSGF